MTGGPDQEDTIVIDATEHYDVTVSICHSAGTDGATVIFIDTGYNPDGSDGGPGLRVMVNDGDVYEGLPYVPGDDE